VAKNQGRNPMVGRHATGGQTARPGGIRGGQGAHVANGVGTGHNQQTASRPAMIPRPPVLANQAETSRDIAQRVLRAPQPFTNTGGAATLPAPAHSQFRSDGNAKESQKRYGGSASASIHSSTSLTADEQRSVGGGMPSERGQHSVISGFPTSGAKRQAGRPGNKNTGTSARENARVRQTGY
jgi:hypothetical protein